jgi:hypothetical protein
VSDEEPVFWAGLRTITLSPQVDPLVEAQLVVAVLADSGWTITREDSQDGLESTALATEEGWLLVVQGDATVEGQSVLALQLASPDLP